MEQTMKKCTYTALLSLIASSACAVEWNDLNVLQINREAPHASMMVFPDARSAMKAKVDRTQSPWFRSLNGDWKFNWVKKPADRPVDFYKPDFSVDSWKTIPVPSNWEIQDYGLRIYSNIPYPFPKNPPNAPTEWNPVGSYRHNFEVPENWKGRETFITFDGVQSAFYLWINGEKVGYSQGSRTPAEFNITKYLKPGKNVLAAEVYRWSDGSYLEDQDFWRLSGIYRDVFIWSTAKSHIRDFTITTNLDKQYKNARMKINAEVINPSGLVIVEVFDSSGKRINGGGVGASTNSQFRMEFANPAKWTAESPVLYTALISLRDKSGKTIEVIPQRIGFRETEIINKRFCVNGVPILIKGVNRHEHQAEMGHTVDRASMIRDIQLLKENNFNAIRTCHYPNMQMWYDLCDEYGIMLWSEANIESHGMGYKKESLAKQPEWKAAHLDRVQRMVEKFKNHTSIVTWSMANEAGDGENFTACYKWIKTNDPTRPIHHERAEGKFENTDIFNKMYSTSEKILKYAESDAEKPYIVCEYMHAMSNSSGGAKEYWDVFYGDNLAQGGFVWDWMDQGLRTPVPAKFKKNIGKGPVKDTFFVYGGWYEDKAKVHHDGNFCMNGLIDADQIPHPGCYAMKYLQRNVHVTPVDLAAGKLKVKNWFDFTTLGDKVAGTWKIEAEGKRIAKGKIQAEGIAPHAEKEISIKMPSIKAEPGKEYFLTVEFTAKKNYHPLVKKGHLLAWDQFKLPVFKESVTETSTKTVKLEQSRGQLMITGDGFNINFSKEKGTLTSYRVGGVELIAAGGIPELSRAQVDNERRQRPKPNLAWDTTGVNAKPKSVIFEQVGNDAKVTVIKELPDVSATFKAVYTIKGDGEVLVQAEYDFSKTPEKILPPLRVGMLWQIPAGFEKLTWFGRKGETYSDRNFEPIGVYSGTVDEQWIEYSRPQANGNKTEVRRISLTNKRGKGILITAVDKPLQASARHYSTDTMRKSEYSFQMERSDNIFLNIDGAQCGVGGINSWGSIPLKPYRLTDKKYSFSYRISAVK